MIDESPCRADLGDGTFLNPIFAGDFPDPSIVRVGEDYWLTHSSFQYGPGLWIWHSRDLVNWRSVGRALTAYAGNIWAPDISFHDGRYWIYFPADRSNWVITARDPTGPWTTPVDLKVGYIDPGHVVGPDGRRWLHLSGGHATALTSDGMATDGEVMKVYEGWPVPSDWVIESASLEGPKLFRRNGWYYLVSAEGGTAGPATSHMVVIARSRSPVGPWDNSPINPIAHTTGRQQRWWSRGHGTLIDTPEGDWWVIYHAYERGYHTLGRQTLLEPVQWTDDGWPQIPAWSDPEKPLPMPRRAATPPPVVLPRHADAQLSDTFDAPRLADQWTFFGEYDPTRFSVGGGALTLNARGTSPADAAPILCIPCHHAYEATIDVSLEGEGEAGLLVYYDGACHGGIALEPGHLLAYRRGKGRRAAPWHGASIRLRLINRHHEISLCHAPIGTEQWSLLPAALDASGYHHNVFGGFISLRLALYATRAGRARFQSFQYRPLADE